MLFTRSDFPFVQVFRCAFRRHPSSSLANDCIAAMSEGLHSSFYEHFASLLWGDDESAYLSNTHSHVYSEWESFSSTILKICQRYTPSHPSHPSPVSETAWDFLTNSKFHLEYSKYASFVGVPFPITINSLGSDCPGLDLEGGQNHEMSFHAQLLEETLESLHAVYENLKLNNLRKR